MHQYIIYYANYKKKKSKVKALMELIKEGVAEVTVTEEKNVNMRRSVTFEHCFGGEETLETTRRRKPPRWTLYSFKKRRRNYMKGKIYLKQLIKDTYAVKRYGKRILVQIKEKEVYKIIKKQSIHR